MTIKYKVGIRIPRMPTTTISESNVSRPSEIVMATITPRTTAPIPMMRNTFFFSASDNGLATIVPASPRFFFLV
ncbi:hypothetical protein D3C80_1628440 [compost metagenome]